MDEERIEEGDTVEVKFANRPDTITNAVVLHVPQATGDSWILKPPFAHPVVYIQLFERMDLVRKGGS